MKYIGNNADRSSFQRLAIRDLSLLGVTVDKIVAQQCVKRNEKVSNILSDSVFGTDLSKVPSTCIDDIGPVPKFLVNSVQFLEKHLDVEGIFRRSGSTTRLKDLRSLVEAGGVVSQANPLDVANLLKQFFRELPDPLLTSALRRSFVQSVSLKECHHRTATILNLCLLLPVPHLATLRHTMCFLQHVASVSERNKMDALNLAICLAPNFLRRFPKKGKQRSCRSDVSEACILEAEIAVIQILILEAQSIGIIPEELFERHKREVKEPCLISNIPMEKNLLEFEFDQTKRKQEKTSFHGLMANLSSSFSRWHKKNKCNSISTHYGLDDLSAMVDSSSRSFLCSPEREFWNASMCPMSAPVSKRKREADDTSLEVSMFKKKRLDANYTESSDRSFLLRRLMVSQNLPESGGIGKASDAKFLSEKEQMLAASTSLETPRRVVTMDLSSTSRSKTSRDMDPMTSSTLSFATPRRKIGNSLKELLKLVRRKRNTQQLDKNRIVSTSITNRANITELPKDFLQYSGESPYQPVDFDMSPNHELSGSLPSFKKRHSIRTQVRPHHKLVASALSSSNSTDLLKDLTNQSDKSTVPSFDCTSADDAASRFRTAPVNKGFIDTSPIAKFYLSTEDKENEERRNHRRATSKELVLSHQSLQTNPAFLEASNDYTDLVIGCSEHDQAFSESSFLCEKSPRCSISFGESEKGT